MDPVAFKQHVCESRGSSCRHFQIIPLRQKHSWCVIGCWVKEAELYRSIEDPGVLIEGWQQPDCVPDRWHFPPSGLS